MLSTQASYRHNVYKISRRDSDAESSASTCSSPTDEYDEDVNHRIYPKWCSYRHIIQRHGFRLDTCRDVKRVYQQYWESLASRGCQISKDLPGYLRACDGQSEDDLCPDMGLPGNLFRGTRCADGVHVIIKAVHLRSREYDVVRYLSSSPVREHRMNHCIPVLHRIEVPSDDLAFIIMEEWSSHLDTDPPHTIRGFLGIIRQHLEHVTFMHAHRLAHLDLNVRNAVINGHRYACIDYETSRRFENDHPRIQGVRSCEPPPEIDRGGCWDPYKADVWALGMVTMRASQLTGFETPGLRALILRLLDEDPDRRPTARQALSLFNSTFRATDRPDSPTAVM
ncbi:hypothetical protein FOMPIDRAFT_42104 [Fomitopsis schrenkii]|uniref:Protein kinase domain-containing protein n=1 Tax=Fomitopsis schrenkii TaxID=2126942 RepID=S8FYM8_FOMSC|nr:hypothetical protein FOMPIDRAFT_42104 [Fomitopsis schrenkii]